MSPLCLNERKEDIAYQSEEHYSVAQHHQSKKIKTKMDINYLLKVQNIIL